MVVKSISVALLLLLSFCHVSAHQKTSVHDPVVALGEDGKYYLFSTGMKLGVKSSTDLENWQREKPVFDVVPQWAMDSVPGYNGHTWAPDIIHHNGKWHLYYSCSTFGKNGSAIGHAVSSTLDASSPDYKWEDKGAVIVSHRSKDNWNAIDPNIAVSKDGRVWLTFGSFWDGIQLVELNKEDMQTPLSEPVTIARRIGKETKKYEHHKNEKGVEANDNAIEAPFIFRHGDWYYLFVSHDYCCRGEQSTYKTMYGRSKDIQGPYLDKEGHRMDEGGGTYLFGPDRENFGIGHCSVYDFEGKPIFFSHAYSKADNGNAILFTKELHFDKTGWISQE